jgi:hypothetical protein
MPKCAACDCELPPFRKFCNTSCKEVFKNRKSNENWAKKVRNKKRPASIRSPFFQNDYTKSKETGKPQREVDSI